MVASLIRRISFEEGDIGSLILGEMRPSSSFREKFSDRVFVTQTLIDSPHVNTSIQVDHAIRGPLSSIGRLDSEKLETISRESRPTSLFCIDTIELK